MAGSRVYDLSHYDAYYQQRRLPFLRFGVAMFVAFTLGGVATAYFAFGGTFGWMFVLIVLIFAGPGSIGLLFQIPMRRSTWLASLTVDSTGLDVVRRSGVSTRARWADPTVTVSVEELPSADLPPALAGRSVWWLHILQPPIAGAIGDDGANAVIDEARRAGLGAREETFDRVRKGRSVGKVHQVVLSMTISTALPNAAGPTAPSAPPIDPTVPREFVLRNTRPPVGGGPRRPDPGPAGSLALSGTTLTVRTSKGKSATYDWRSPALAISLTRVLRSEVDAADDPTAEWGLTIRPPKLEGFVPEAAYATLVATARAYGVPVTVAKSLFPGGKGSKPFWYVQARIGQPP